MTPILDSAFPKTLMANVPNHIYTGLFRAFPQARNGRKEVHSPSPAPSPLHPYPAVSLNLSE